MMTTAMGWGRLADMEATEAYSAERDVGFFQGPGTFFTVPAGHFTIFAPHDVHQPGLATPRSKQVRKVVFKMEGPGLHGPEDRHDVRDLPP